MSSGTVHSDASRTEAVRPRTAHSNTGNASTALMGILNVTPDSFSDGGRYLDAKAAITHGLHLLEQGAQIIDVGGESTRPGSVRVGAEEEQRRVLPVVAELVKAGAAVSVDTMSADTMRACLDVGAHIINDVSAGQMDPGMFGLAADSGAEIILMHWRGLLTDPHVQPHYDDVIADVRRELMQRVDTALEAGIAAENIIIDPGPGFSKNAEHNWQLLGHLSEFTQLGYRLLWAGSRKRFLASMLNPADPAAAVESDRDLATAATTILAAQAGAWAVRVHDVRSSAIALQVLENTSRGNTSRGIAGSGNPSRGQA